jgi:hypothetical protein
MENTHSLDGVPLLLGHCNSLGSRGQWGIVVGVLAKQAEELLGILGNELGQLRVARSELLQDRLQHLGLLLDNLAELLELWVVSQEVQVTESLPASCCGGHSGSRSRSRSSTTSSSNAGTTGTTSPLLCGQVEKVHTVITASGSWGGGRGSGRSSGRGRGRGWLGGWRGMVLLLQVFWDSLVTRQPYVSTTTCLHSFAHVQEVLDGTIWVVESGAHGSIDLGSLKTHRLHVRNSLGTLPAQSQGVGVVVVGFRAAGRRGGCGRCGGSRGRTRGGRGGRWCRRGGLSSWGGGCWYIGRRR